MAWSAPTRSPTAWCFNGPAEFSIVISFIMNPVPDAAASVLNNRWCQLRLYFGIIVAFFLPAVRILVIASGTN